MAIEKGTGDLNHIEFQREPTRQPEIRRRRGFGASPPRPANRATHAQDISDETSTAVSEITQSRQASGVDPTMLLVLEFDSVEMDLRDQLEDRFGAIVVDEQRAKVNDVTNYRYIVQFRDRDAVQQFEQEIDHYRNENPTTIALPQGGRRDFFDALQHARQVTREERQGHRLASEGIPDAASFYLDVDLWHPGDVQSAQALRQEVRNLCNSLGGQWRDAVQTRSMILGKVSANRALCERLLELDLVARVDLPSQLSDAYLGIFRDPSPSDPGRMPDEDDGLACVIDSGVIAGHPMLSNWVLDERDFDSGEDTPADLNGHGTSIAGLVVYGDIADCIENDEWIPRVRICNAKVLQDDPVFGGVVFPEQNRIEETIEQAIRHFHKERNCRVFNMSIGDDREIYAGGRQFPLAEKLDELARELDVVIVLAAGNRGDLPIPDGCTTRNELQQAIRDGLLGDNNQRLCNPARASLAITVGAIARSDAVSHQNTLVPGSPAGAPAPFTRIGPGYSASETAFGIKPEIVAFGGNIGVETLAGGAPRWIDNNVWLGEPTIRPERDGRILTGQRGTSFAAPHVTHAAACIERSLTQSLGRAPSANAIRAVIGTAIRPTPFQQDWIADEEMLRRACGYGTLDLKQALWFNKNDICLLAEDAVEEQHLHIFKIEVPPDFLEKKGTRGIVVSLAYAPPVRASRRDYLARTMTVDLLHGLTEDEVESFRAHQPGTDQPSLPSRNDLDPSPARTKLERSTLQIRTKSWTRKPQLRANTTGGQPILHVLVSCRQRFPTGEAPNQSYALAIRLWHENNAAELHNQIRTRIRTTARVRV